MASIESVPFSELQRQPTEALSHLARSSRLRLSRRDADDLMLMYAERAEAEMTMVGTMVRILEAVLHLEPDLLPQILPTVLPWTRFLPNDDLPRLVREFLDTAEAAASIGNLAPLSQLLIGWQHTAEVHADPELFAALTRPDLDDFGPVTAPAS
jgi:hypothetical protein